MNTQFAISQLNGVIALDLQPTPAKGDSTGTNQDPNILTSDNWSEHFGLPDGSPAQIDYEAYYREQERIQNEKVETGHGETVEPNGGSGETKEESNIPKVYSPKGESIADKALETAESVTKKITDAAKGTGGKVVIGLSVLALLALVAKKMSQSPPKKTKTKTTTKKKSKDSLEGVKLV